VLPVVALKEATCLSLTLCVVKGAVVAVLFVRCSLEANHIIGLYAWPNV